MKRVLTTLAVILVSANAANAFTWKSEPSFDAEAAKQRARIAAGVKSGKLSKYQAYKLNQQLEQSFAVGHAPGLSKSSKMIAAAKG
jgi:hypothetical protein